MKIKIIEQNPEESLIYLDRYVNDGSPSGYTDINKTSLETDTFSLNKDFKLLTIESSKSDFKIYGSLKANIPLASEHFYIHPDMKDHANLKGCKIFKQENFTVSPTSSFRTVKILSKNSTDYIKLHYDAVLGRINRKLNYKKAISGVEISEILKENIKSKNLSDFISILEEPFAKIFKNPSLKDEDDYWGLVWRNAKPVGNKSEEIKYIIPLFSFWSKDRNDDDATTLGIQLFEKWGTNAKTKFVSEILIPVLDAYFELLVKIGLQNEYNAQNLLIGFDDSWNAVSIIIRDMMGIEKDIDLRKALGLSTTFDSAPYKVISSDNPVYLIRHSFTFDFKVCDYVINPLVELATNSELATRNELIELLKQRTSYWTKQLPDNYFPKDVWYSHNKVDLSIPSNREYIKNNNPLLR